MATRTKNRPVYAARCGRLSVTVWLNDGQNGEYYQVAPQRAYQEDGDLRNTASFSESDVPLLSRLLGEAFTWMRAHPLEQERASA